MEGGKVGRVKEKQRERGGKARERRGGAREREK